MNQTIKVIITGATGMVGNGVLRISLAHPAVEQVLVINRKSCGVQHPKLTEIIHHNLYDLSPVAERLKGYDACFFCLGISSVGISKEDYYKTTNTLTMHVAERLRNSNEAMTFCYISGAGTSETSWQQWAKVKAKTEQDIIKLFPQHGYGLRPGFIKPLAGQQYIQSLYKYMNWLFPIGRRLFPGAFCTINELALCMIHIAQHGYPKKILEGKDIIEAAKTND